MVFTPTNLFKGIACPYGGECSLTNCIFSHDLRPQNIQTQQTSFAKPQDARASEPPSKRRKVTYDSASSKPPSKADDIRSQLAAARTGTASETDTGETVSAKPKTLTRPVSPPQMGLALSRYLIDKYPDKAGTTTPPSQDRSKAVAVPTPKVTKEPIAIQESKAASEKLNPRLISNDPVGHSKRALYLKHLHAEMLRLNHLVRDSDTLEHKRLLHLTDAELIKMALDEEEKVAREQSQLYPNIIKNRIAHYRKMKVEDWAQHIQTSFKKPAIQVTLKQKPADALQPQTGLTPREEQLLLPGLVADQSRLTSYGYIPTPPTEAEATKAAEAVEASRNYEVCDRCSARFQVFPNRNEEGLLTSNGRCKHHPNRRVFPDKTRADFAMGNAKEAYYPCCNATVGSPGCTVTEHHVFKSSSPARLAAVLPFITTPENEKPKKDRSGKDVVAVTFDCEMGYTVYGLELIRLTAVAWPSGEELVDVLVRPLGTVIDFNSRFSGVWPEHFTKAVPYDEWMTAATPTDATTPRALPIVNNPQAARSLLCSFLTPTTPLIGHAIDNDLNAVRLCHPTIIDTVLLFPHPRGLPMRFGLKMLSARHLNRSIQTGGDRGHDSLEDAMATGDLVRVKIGEKWKALRAQGWRIADGELLPP
ncbi:hypothetical protein BDY17DRAFT_238357, partial [Neohortaea acidophila]